MKDRRVPAQTNPVVYHIKTELGAPNRLQVHTTWFLIAIFITITFKHW